MNNTGKIYVLAIGLEDYHHSVNRNPLPGCRKDVNDFINFLQDKFEADGPDRLFTHQLLDMEATRANIIGAFLGQQDELGQWEPSLLEKWGKVEKAEEEENKKNKEKEDTFIFYYSGHGSIEKAAPEFNMSNNQNETLLCYDSRKPGMYDLADKELNYLISTVTPHFKNTLVIVDSCHADSVMRDENDWSERHEPTGDGPPRPFDSYLPEAIQYYRSSNKLPGDNFITMSACSYNESAYGSVNGGFFTRHLIGTLQASEDKVPSYDELIYQIKAKIGMDRVPQHPRLGCWGEVNPHWRFLTREIAVKQQMPTLYWEKENASWYINVGAFNGYRAEEVIHQHIPIFIKGKEKEDPVFKAQIDQLGVDKSKLTFVEGFPPTNPKDVYVAGITRPIFRVNFRNNDSTLSALLDAPDYNFLNDDEAEISLRVEPDSYTIYQGEMLVHGIKGKDKENAIYILNHLQEIADWHFAMNLHSPNFSTIPEREVSFSLSYEGMDLKKDLEFNSLEKQNFDHVIYKGRDIPFTLTIKNDTAYDLYYALLHLDRKFNIGVWNDGGQTILRSGKEITEDAEFFIEEEDIDKVQDTFLLIVAKQQLNVGNFQRLPFPEDSDKWRKIFDPSLPSRGARKGVKRGKRDVGTNWLVKRIDVTTSRNP